LQVTTGCFITDKELNVPENIGQQWSPKYHKQPYKTNKRRAGKIQSVKENIKRFNSHER